MTMTVRRSTTDELFELEPRVIDRVDEPVDRLEVLRYLGYPVDVTPKDSIGNIIDHWIEQAHQFATPRATYLVRPVTELAPRQLCVQSSLGVVEFKGAIGEYLGASQSVAAFIATAGPAVERRASELLQEGDSLGAMILNAIGAERAEAADQHARAGGVPHRLVRALRRRCAAVVARRRAARG